MRNIPRFVPVWLWVTIIIITVLLCSSCRGGRSLSKGSTGTVIIPQTPQQINERNSQPPLEIITPVVPATPIIIEPHKSARSTPTTPESNKSAEANPVIINPKPAGVEPKSFTPTINKNTTSVKLTAAKSKEKVNVIKLPEKNEAIDNKATDGESALGDVDNRWDKLTYYYLFLFIAMILGWVIYDTVQTYRLRRTLDNRTQVKKKAVKKPAKATRASRKKALSKKNEKSKR